MPEAFTRANQKVDGSFVPLLEAAQRLGVYVMASASVYQGLLTKNLPSMVAELLPGFASDAQRALQFVRSTPGIGTALVGMKSTTHVEENAAVARRPPTPWKEFQRPAPLDASSGVGRFLARRGEGLHHVCFDTLDIQAALAVLDAKHVELIDTAPRPGLAGAIAFLHPKACCGVLVELATPAEDAASDGSPVRLKRLVVGARDVKQTAGVVRSRFGL